MKISIHLDEYRQLARERLGDARYRHTLAVARLGRELAEHYGISGDQAEAAGLLHDITKEVPKADQLQILKNSDIMMDKVFQASTNVYHSATAFLFVRDKLGIDDTDILNAIRYHTTGREGMSLLEKIIYTADAVSYDRDYPDAERLRKLAFADLDECMLEIIEFTLKKLTEDRYLIAEDTVFCYNSILLARLGKKENGTGSIPEAQHG